MVNWKSENSGFLDSALSKESVQKAARGASRHTTPADNLDDYDNSAFFEEGLRKRKKRKKIEEEEE